MSGLSSKGEALVITALTTGLYVSLHTSDPSLGDPPGGGGEVPFSGGYGRLGPITGWTNTGSNPTVASNSGTLTFTQATAAWGTISFFGYWDAPTGGNFRGGAGVTTVKAVNSGDTARFSAGTLTISVN
jgi:hypothetical protein